METITFNVEGMSCAHCVSSIEGAVNELEGVCHSKANLNNNTVEVMYDGSKIEVGRLKEVVEDTGYQVVS